MFKKGSVAANSTLVLENGYSLIYDNQTLPGMSGGAVLNQNGELVAIHGKGDRELKSDGDFGDKTGNNLGIPINRFATISTSLGVNLNEKVAAIPQTTTLKAGDYYALGKQKGNKGDYRGALADYDRAIQLDPNYVFAYVGRAILKEVNLNDTQGALADLDRAIQIDPNYAKSYANRGILKTDKLNDTQGALADYDRAIQLNPNYANAYGNRAILKRDKLKDTQGALADFNRAIQLNPNYANAYFERGRLKYEKLNDRQGGLADRQRAIELNPSLAR